MPVSPIPVSVAGPSGEQLPRRPELQSQQSAPAAPVVEVPSDAVQATDATQNGEELKEALKKLNEMAQQLSNSNTLSFSVDDEVNAVVVRVVDRHTDQVIRQIPTEEAIAIAKAIDQFRGLLIQDRA